MTDIKTKVQGVNASVEPRDVEQFVEKADNIYEALAVIAKRANQLSVNLKKELNDKLDEFAINPETIEEITENKEQIEISKFYERLPNPAIIATNEYFDEEIHFHYKDGEGGKAGNF